VALDNGAGADQMSGTIYPIENQSAFVKMTMRIAGDEESVASLRDNLFLRDPVQIGDAATASWHATTRSIHASSQRGGH
jgi:hypothetical protein